MALDPGQNFGIASYHPYPSVPGMNFDVRTEYVGRDGHMMVADMITQHYELVHSARRAARDLDPENYFDPEGYLIVEKFEFRKDDQERDRIDFTPGEYVGVAKLVGWDIYGGDNVIMQGSAKAKGFWTDEKLDKLGLRGNTRHGRDALRHLLHYMVFYQRQRWLLSALK